LFNIDNFTLVVLTIMVPVFDLVCHSTLEKVWKSIFESAWEPCISPYLRRDQVLTRTIQVSEKTHISSTRTTMHWHVGSYPIGYEQS